ncbi:MAG: protein kinase domain-containing protein, partial [Aeoliella sp.]
VGMVHGDVKPENLVLAPTGHATLLDLGFASSKEESNDWANRPVMGSLAYIAPELVTSTYSAGPPSDQYSLGVMLYELLAGRLPFDGNDPAELVAQHRGQKPVCLRTLRPDIPKSVASLVHSLLSKDPLRRGGTHGELAERLVRLEIDSFAFRAGA